MPPSPPLRLRIDGDPLVANWRWLAAQAGAACGAAVKADGYGLGARAVVAQLAAAGCRDFFCASWAEADALGPLPDGTRLSVLHGVRAEDMATALSLPQARPVLNTPAQVARWREAGGGPCDVMVDTGINRLGLTPAEARSGLLEGLAIETLLSHLACADEPGHPLNARQLADFRDVRAAVWAQRYSLANSAGILLGAEHCFDLTRPGIALYGGIPTPGSTAEGHIRRVVSLEAQILQLRALPDGATVGYGATWRANGPARIAILNIGYADGLARQIGPSLHAIVAGERRSLAGRISMDLIAIDIGGADVAEGDWVALDLDLPALAAASSLTQYELLTGLGARLPRIWE